MCDIYCLSNDVFIMYLHVLHVWHCLIEFNAQFVCCCLHVVVVAAKDSYQRTYRHNYWFTNHIQY
jgi:general stress protein CsbA